MVTPTDSGIPDHIAREISELWDIVHTLAVALEEPGDTVDLVVKVTCRGQQLSGPEWRSLNTYFREFALGTLPPPGPVTSEMMQSAVTNPLPGVREIGYWLAQYIVS